MVFLTEQQQLLNLYQILPTQQRQQIVRKAQDYVLALDRAINAVLAPTVRWDEAQGQYVALDDVIPLYGVGSTVKEALDEYRSVVVEYYESLEENEAQLSDWLKEQFVTLRQIFARLE